MRGHVDPSFKETTVAEQSNSPRKKPGPKPIQSGQHVQRIVVDEQLQTLLFNWLVRREEMLINFRQAPEWRNLREALVDRIQASSAATRSTIEATAEGFLTDLVTNHENYDVGGDSLFLTEWVDTTVEALALPSEHRTA